MRPFELAVGALLAVGPALGVPLHGVPVHDTALHVLVDSVLGLVVGVAVVAAYLLVLRGTDETRDGASENSAERPSRRHESRNS